MLSRQGVCILVFPAASKPSMSRRISLDPKIFPMIFDTCPPILVEVPVCKLSEFNRVDIQCSCGRIDTMVSECRGRFVEAW